MIKEWQFNILFLVGVGGAILLLLGPDLGLKVGQNPTAIAGIGSILGYVLTQKKAIVKSNRETQEEREDEDES